MNTRLTFRQGIIDALPIFFGYFSVSIAFGILSATRGVPVWLATAVSMTAFTGTGQFVWIDLIASGAAIIETLLTMLVINARYFLMSLSYSQKLPANMTLWQRLVVGFGNTDEVFAIAMTRDEPLNFKYLLGLILCSYCGWISGTAVGGLASGIISDTILSALGIALYAMFIALVVPPAKKSKPVLAVVLGAAALNTVMRFIPFLEFLGDGWLVIVSGIAAAAIAAAVFPVKEESETETAPDETEHEAENIRKGAAVK